MTERRQESRRTTHGINNRHRHGLWTLALATAVLSTAVYFAPMARSASPVIAGANSGANQQVASVEQLKTEAFHALKIGQFDRSSELLKTAASMSSDPAVAQMSGWVGQFETQQAGFAAERHKQFEKTVGEVHKLLDADKVSFAADKTREAYVLADDKDAFRHEIWVDSLVHRTIDTAAACEQSQEWFKAVRLYSDLGAVEPANPLWKDKLKLATRRIRLLAVYTPDLFKAIQEAEVKERDEADVLLNPTTKPTSRPISRPASRPATEENDSFRIDWHDQLRGINTNMLLVALNFARAEYWRDISYQTLLSGGLRGMQALATTPGLEKAFPNLSDVQKKQAFSDFLDSKLQAVATAAKDGKDNEELMRLTIEDLEQTNANTLNLPENVIVSEFSDGAFAELDPFTSMIWPSDVEEFNKSTQGEFSGVGIQIQLDEDGSLKVASPLEDSPAYKQGIKAGDVISRINGKNAKGITLNQAVKTITGPSGTTVMLTIRSPGGEVVDRTIKREVIHVASVKGWQHLNGGGWDYMVDHDQKIAYVRLTNFTKGTDEEMDKAIAEMREKGARAMILDLRYNPGGLLTAATAVCDKFMREGVIVSTKAEREGAAPPPPAAEARSSADDVDFPLVVLVNQYSASASEIVSGALHDQHRATIVGERTFGKGSVQMLYPLAGRSSYLKLTTSHYYLPSGKCIHREENSTTWGVDPDVTVPMTPKQMGDAIEARQDLDVLHGLHEQDAPVSPNSAQTAPKPESSVTPPPAREPGSDSTGQTPKPSMSGALPELGATTQTVTTPTTKPAKKPVLDCDPQLSAALLVLRLQLAGAAI